MLHTCSVPRLLLQALALAALTSYIYPSDAATSNSDSAHNITLKPTQVQKLGIRSSQIQAAGDAGRVVLQGLVTLPPNLLRVVSAPVAALVEQVQISKGDAVKQGQTLVTLNAPQLVEWQREYQQAQLQLKLAQQTAQRDEALLAEGIIAGSRAQASQAQLQIAQATVRERGQMLQLAGVKPNGSLSGHAVMSAPQRGTVIDMLVQPGQRVEAGAPILKFASEGALSIDMQAAPDVARRLRKGDVVRISGCALPARIVNINTELDAGSQTLSLRAQWPQAQDCALPQQRVQAEVALTPRADAAQAGNWLVPATAVLRHDGQDIVFVQRGSSYQAVNVRVISQSAAGNGNGNGSLTQISPVAPAQFKADDLIVNQGTVALKGVLQGLGAE
ncbi:MAG: HlyD family efflux transporter periplasmic adaptor subunit [Aquabacterium sp.]|uniref:efflux RND transporter periplasmic adaptor subunit n=1 Tax=Aquabacterium sp. TaxID=1872578 RepID=UPI0011FAE604|nr:efflux RND transporter periplasmic adaptor subunit [Aquabacterium sp.]TAK90851.1 MAG: HlyD family efflux transporter periplasmic adaptor subunit [Aquabacterium sp.]